MLVVGITIRYRQVDSLGLPLACFRPSEAHLFLAPLTAKSIVFD